jgi:aminomethyltransferase
VADQTPKTIPLDALHRALGARMVPFAGYAMPVQYPAGIIAEHTLCRQRAALFDVSHMGQAVLTGDDVAAAFETLCPGAYRDLKVGRQRYTVLTTETGGILDDLMVARTAKDRLVLVVNAARKDADFAHIRARLAGRAELEILEDRALIALQGPEAGAVMAHFAPATDSMVFMDAGRVDVGGIPCLVTRSGYTGEDGFEISVAAPHAETLVRRFLEMEAVGMAGLGARDSLRLEAGLPLYGADIDETTTPVEAGLAFAIGKRRRAEGGFPGAETILRHLADGPPRQRVGIQPEGRVPARAHTEVQDTEGRRVGEITSGGFGPTVGGPIAMGLVETACAAPGTPLVLIVRGKPIEARVVDLPFVEQRYRRR